MSQTFFYRKKRLRHNVCSFPVLRSRCSFAMPRSIFHPVSGRILAARKKTASGNMFSAPVRTRLFSTERRPFVPENRKLSLTIRICPHHPGKISMTTDSQM